MRTQNSDTNQTKRIVFLIGIESRTMTEIDFTDDRHYNGILYKIMYLID